MSVTGLRNTGAMHHMSAKVDEASRLTELGTEHVMQTTAASTFTVTSLGATAGALRQQSGSTEHPTSKSSTAEKVIHHTILRSVPQIEDVPVEIPVVQVDVHEKVEELQQVIVHEKVVEVPSVQYAEITKQVPKVEYKEQQKHIAKPIYTPAMRDVEVHTVVTKEILQEVPTVTPMDLIKQVPLHVSQPQVVQKQVAKPMVQVASVLLISPSV